MKKDNHFPTSLARQVDAVSRDQALIGGPRPTVDAKQLQGMLRQVLSFLHVDMNNENLRDTPRRWADSLITMTSGYDFTDYIP